MEIFSNGQWLPLVFAALMGLAMVIYAVLDGYDLGTGMLMRFAEPDEQDVMIASIGPFWDANETWLVLGVGLLLVAFPLAHGVILTALYLPVAFMLIGLILRGVAFDFRAKAKTARKEIWNKTFMFGSALTGFAQGYMLGSYILGFDERLGAVAFSVLTGFSVCAGYCLIGAGWLLMKTEAELQKKAARWGLMALGAVVQGIALVSLATPLVSPRIFDKWFTMPNVILLSPLPIVAAVLIAVILRNLLDVKKIWVPFVATVGLFITCFVGLAYSFYPYIVPEKMLIVDAAADKSSLLIILVGALIVLPVLIGYTFLAYKIFHGKAGKDLSYD